MSFYPLGSSTTGLPPLFKDKSPDSEIEASYLRISSPVSGVKIGYNFKSWLIILPTTPSFLDEDSSPPQ